MKRCLVLFTVLVLTLAILKPTALATPPPNPDNDNMWAVIICGDKNLQTDAKYLYDVLTHHYHFTEILFIRSTPSVNINKSIIRSGIRDWLGARSNEDDLIFIFIISHGLGAYDYNETTSILAGGRYELNSDEGDEYAETELVYGAFEFFGSYWTPGSNVDFDDDGIIEDDVYAGVDECIRIGEDWNNASKVSLYWDDEVKEDLDTLSYGRLVFFFQGCYALNHSGHCFSGGFVRDLSAPNRIIITSANETRFSYGHSVDGSVETSGNFSLPFISALDPWNGASQADVDGNGLVSVGEAFRYAWEHDTAVEGRWVFTGPPLEFQFWQETPWLDDDGDGIANHLDGAFANETFFARALPVQEHRYVVMEGVTTTCGQHNVSNLWYWDKPFHTRDPYLTPLLMGQDITFSNSNDVTGVVYLTVPAESYVGLDHIFYDSSMYYSRHRLIMESDGYGWLFTGEGTTPILGDVDCITFSTDTGTYWDAPGDPYGFNGTLVAPKFGYARGLPSPGPDGVAGTGDDGFGDGSPDPPGSSILYLPTTLDVDYYDPSAQTWADYYEVPWPQVLTTAVAYNIVTEPASAIDDVSSTVVGEPWEFLAGEDHQEYDPVP